jgi:hypothetical protein
MAGRRNHPGPAEESLCHSFTTMLRMSLRGAMAQFHIAAISSRASCALRTKCPTQRFQSRKHGRVILVAGGDDALWPSDLFARALADRLKAAGKDPLLITHPEAGHRVLLPGETTRRSATNALGGSIAADQRLVWPPGMRSLPCSVFRCRHRQRVDREVNELPYLVVLRAFSPARPGRALYEYKGKWLLHL